MQRDFNITSRFYRTVFNFSEMYIAIVAMGASYRSMIRSTYVCNLLSADNY